MCDLSFSVCGAMRKYYPDKILFKIGHTYVFFINDEGERVVVFDEKDVYDDTYMGGEDEDGTRHYENTIPNYHREFKVRKLFLNEFIVLCDQLNWTITEIIYGDKDKDKDKDKELKQKIENFKKEFPDIEGLDNLDLNKIYDEILNDLPKTEYIKYLGHDIKILYWDDIGDIPPVQPRITATEARKLIREVKWHPSGFLKKPGDK